MNENTNEQKKKKIIRAQFLWSSHIPSCFAVPSFLWKEWGFVKNDQQHQTVTLCVQCINAALIEVINSSRTIIHQQIIQAWSNGGSGCILQRTMCCCFFTYWGQEGKIKQQLQNMEPESKTSKQSNQQTLCCLFFWSQSQTNWKHLHIWTYIIA